MGSRQVDLVREALRRRREAAERERGADVPAEPSRRFARRSRLAREEPVREALAAEAGALAGAADRRPSAAAT